MKKNIQDDNLFSGLTFLYKEKILYVTCWRDVYSIVSCTEDFVYDDVEDVGVDFDEGFEDVDVAVGPVFNVAGDIDSASSSSMVRY